MDYNVNAEQVKHFIFLLLSHNIVTPRWKALGVAQEGVGSDQLSHPESVCTRHFHPPSWQTNSLKHRLNEIIPHPYYSINTVYGSKYDSTNKLFYWGFDALKKMYPLFYSHFFHDVKK